MDQSQQSGFSLFPMPPTPPANKHRAMRLLRDQHQVAEEPLPSIQFGPPTTARQEANLVQLRPAPLKLRKKRQAQLNDSTYKSTLRVVNPDPEVLAEAEQDLPGKDRHPPSPRNSAYTQVTAVPRTSDYSPCVGEDFQSAWGALPVEDTRPVTQESHLLPPPSRASDRSSQWLGSNGHVDRQKLSVYLSEVLDSSFQVIEASDRDDLLGSHYLLSPQLGKRYIEESHHNYNESNTTTVLLEQVRRPPINACSTKQARYTRPSTVRTQCGCPPGVVMCHSRSSQEFEQFRRHPGEHKSNPSVSSTKCILAVPRARFRGTLAEIEEPGSPSSPPALMYDSEGSEDSDWSLPNSPLYEEMSVQPMQVTPTPAPRPAVVPRPNAVSRSSVPSFSLPFTHGRQITPRVYRDTMNTTTSGDPFCSSPTSTVPTLASISTISTFTFDFGKGDDDAEYDPFDSSEVSEIRTYEPIKKAKPTLVHCRGPSPTSIKYSQTSSFKSRGSSRPHQSSADSQYSGILVRV